MCGTTALQKSASKRWIRFPRSVSIKSACCFSPSITQADTIKSTSATSRRATPFEGVPGAFDFRRPNPAYFKEFEDRLNELRERDIIADVILFHPYDFGHWDLDIGMDEDDALVYLRYIIARISSHPPTSGGV